MLCSKNKSADQLCSYCRYGGGGGGGGEGGGGNK